MTNQVNLFLACSLFTLALWQRWLRVGFFAEVLLILFIYADP